MQVYSTLASIFTVISFFIFVGIVCWAWSARRKPAFDAAAVEPFALPDEGTERDRVARSQPPRDLRANASEGGRP
jgi:cytochrome c oxidase cbb3-type subunit 4